MADNPVRVLVVEDDSSIGALLRLELSDAGYDVEVVSTGRAAIERVADDPPQFVILDVRLPDLDGLTVCRQVRRDGFDGSVLMLTALDRVGDRVIGLDSGADDYLAKPFAIEEVLARLRALQRRSRDELWLTAGRVNLRRDTREVTVDERAVSLTAREFDLLAFFVEAPGRVFTREQIYEAVWGYNYPSQTKVIDYFVSELRKKLDAPGDEIIRTVRGVGYAARA